MIQPAPVAANSARDGADGIVGLYAARVLDRGGDLRLITAQARQARFGTSDRPLARSRVAIAPTAQVGRGAAPERAKPVRQPAKAPSPARPRPRTALPALPGLRPSRRLVAAAVAVLLMLPFAALVAGATDAPGPDGTAAPSFSQGVVRSTDSANGLAGPFR